ncbi:MAG TPA: hypothetical protein VGO90_06170 [Chthoniobacteraceae bacterium]|jgi:hypothetical protein|nr:hypothetical protein [Chthoniobacter sp.]HEV7867248.1 hypothetical protein [Chthoniobacteraceae bacterium]
MKTKSLVSIVSAVCSTLAIAAEVDSTQLQVYSKNFARQHLGSNLFVFNASNGSYVPTEASAAWLDDDVTTGWPVMAGKQHYLLALSEPELLNNFSVSTRPADGTVTLYAGDEAAAPGAKSWALVAKDVPLDSINDKKMGRPFSRFAKYLLIETDIANPGPLFSLYVYGDKPAVTYRLRKREQTIDARSIFGQYVNNSTNFNLTGLYSASRVSYSNSPDGYLSWQRGIDDNPETGIVLAASSTESGAVIALGEKRSVSRVSVLTETGPKGKLDFYAVNTAPANTAVALDGLTPTVSVVLDGSNARASIDFPATEASQILLRWSPVTPDESLTIREVNSFNALTLNEYEVGLRPEVIAEFSGAATYDTSKGGDGKDYKDAKAEPVALGPTGSPYLPGALGFPPVLTGRLAPVSP